MRNYLLRVICYGMSGVAILYVEIYVLYIKICMDLKKYLWTKNIYLSTKIKFVDKKCICGLKNIFVM